MKKEFIHKSLAGFCLSLALCLPIMGMAQAGGKGRPSKNDVVFHPVTDSLRSFLKPLAEPIGVLSIDSVNINDKNKTLHLIFSGTLAQYPFRTTLVRDIYAKAARVMPAQYKSYKLSIESGGKEISEWIPLFYRETGKSVKKKTGKTAKKEEVIPLKIPLSRPYYIDKGLQNKHLAVWQSHGFYFEQKLDRWEWQRARIFQTVEDLYTQSYILPFVVPMLENAGAVVFMPRERDIQYNEVIVDNDMPGTRYYEMKGSKIWSTPADSGFANPKPVYVSGENPFRMGTYRQIETITAAKKSKDQPSYAYWLANLPEAGSYAVYVSYKTVPNSSNDVLYTVYHKGGKSEFRINQTMGGGTWIYLGHFEFNKGLNDQCKVELSNLSGSKGKMVTADGVKFGGGMGNIARSPSTQPEPNRQSALAVNANAQAPVVQSKSYAPVLSNYPRFTEGARYWLQWAGMPDSVYAPNQGRNDYNDDYMSRGLWVNYMSGLSKVNPHQKGLNIPIDLSMAFHTDAGTTLTDSIVGTLGIYTSNSNGSTDFPDGRSRFTSRDLTDLIQTQIVSDIQAQYEPEWMRRGIWDRSYSESRSPKVPAMLLELLSHQNLADMKYGLDPGFRFTVSRAIYKGMLKYLSSVNGTPYVVQPLPVAQFAVNFGQNNQAVLSWRPVSDTLEPTAQANAYVLYTRVDEGAFDNGVRIEGTQYSLPIEFGRTYSFKVTAINDGGQSFPSEILSIHRAFNEKGRILIVNGFDRVSAPASFASTDALFGGFQDYEEHGLAYINDISYIGSQYDFRRRIPWMDDDAPGFGGSYATYETKVLAGNTFDYPVVHGSAFAQEGYSYTSCSQKAFMRMPELATSFKVIDLILGKQHQTIVGTGKYGIVYAAFPDTLQKRIQEYCHAGGNMLISGAYVASDLWDAPKTDTSSQAFAKKVLKFKWMTNHASQGGKVKPALSPFPQFASATYTFYNQPNANCYWTESPDGLVPSGPQAHSIFRYADNNISAGVAYKGFDYKTVVLGFPIECIIDTQERNLLLKNILDFFTSKE